jgi:hypothetical protein
MLINICKFHRSVDSNVYVTTNSVACLPAAFPTWLKEVLRVVRNSVSATFDSCDQLMHLAQQQQQQQRPDSLWDYKTTCPLFSSPHLIRYYKLQFSQLFS